MRNLRQGAFALEGGDSVAMQQLMETIRVLQQAMAVSRAEQDRVLAEVQAEQAANQDLVQYDLAVLCANNEELHIANEELRRDLQRMGERTNDEPNPPITVRALPRPFSQAIMDTVVPASFMVPKIAFTGVEDPEAHITAFHTQMMISGRTNAMHCKLFMRTFSGITLDSFISLPNGHITSFYQFSNLFREQFIVNQIPPPISFDLFDVKQYQGEPLKDFLNRFGALVVKLHTTNEAMVVHVFRCGILSGPFSDSLIRCRPKTFSEIRRRAVAHIGVEEELSEKRGSLGPARPRGIGCPQLMRVHEATKEKKAPGKQRPYETRKPQTRVRTKEGAPTRHSFQMDLKELISIPNMADRLKSPTKTDKRLWPSKDTWCEFHQAFGHSLRNCLALGFQLDELVRNGVLKEYLQEP